QSGDRSCASGSLELWQLPSSCSARIDHHCDFDHLCRNYAFRHPPKTTFGYHLIDQGGKTMRLTNSLNRYVATSALAAVVALSTAFGASAQTEIPADLVEAAKSEGSLTVYTNVDPTLVQKLGDAFSAAYGVTVDIQRQASSALAQR